MFGRVTRNVTKTARLMAPLGRSLNAVARIHTLKFISVSSKRACNQQQIVNLVPRSSGQSLRLFSSNLPKHTELAMPALSPTMAKGNISKWRKREGDKINPGEVLCEVETDKATVDFEAQDEGYLAKILVPEGTQDVPVGQPVAIIVDEAADADKFKSYSASSSAPAAPKAEPQQSAQPAQAQPAATQAAHPPAYGNSAAPSASSAPAAAAPSSAPVDRVFASPLARKIAEENKVSLSQIAGTGPNNRIIRADVEQFIESGATAKATQPQAVAAVAQPTVPAPVSAAGAGEYTDMPLSNMRKVIARRLLESKTTIPHYYLSIDCEIDALLSVRAQLNTEGAGADGKGGPKLTINDFIIKAAALALRKVPEANSSWMDTVIRRYHNVDVSVAVSTDAGLITPIVRNADMLGLATIASSVKQLAEKAKTNKLQPNEYQGGTFTISNLGMYGTKSFAAIINPPQSCILAIGAGTKQLMFDPSVKDPTKQPYRVATVMNVTLSCDHRVVDGAVGAQWLQAFKGFIEKPVTMML
eukprot:GILJ01002417.1.p1 GENE.GILJ01002417.1~~GILJ01002417.1.p1  ORF type:complete len:544 (+),score=108.69 GILJ01002417.1:47-1633(+)